ncbi:MAG: sigma-54 dependent transcriptional regulator [Desulfobacterales bacterium]
MANILVIDDEKMICDLMTRVVMRMGHTVRQATTLKDGLRAAQLEDFEIIFLDVQLPDGNGLVQLPFIEKFSSKPEVIVITGFADSEGIEQAIKSNAWDYIQKPLSVEAITQSIDRALQYRKQRRICRRRQPLKRDGIVGGSQSLMNCLDLVARAAASQANILITGETGTGKELFARAIHSNSSRADKNFIVIDCGSLPESLIENLLLGHAKGAFTGADKAEEGLIKRADGGTLFLDEVGELTPAMQKVFLRVLQERSFYPIGDILETKSDFRLVAASNRNLKQMVKTGQFREDLLFRICSITIDIPPLRQRDDDVMELARHYMDGLCESQKIEHKAFSSDFLEVLKTYHWPGNVRELFSALEATLAHAFHEPTLFAKDLPKSIRIEVARASLGLDFSDIAAKDPSLGASATLPSWQTFRKEHIASGEREYLQKLIACCRGNVHKAAVHAGLSRPHLYGLLRKYSIST